MARAASSCSHVVLTIFVLCCWPVTWSGGLEKPQCGPTHPADAAPICGEDVDRLQFAQNLEHLEAEFFLWGALGYGLDKVAPSLAKGGPPPIGSQKANLDALTRRIITEFGYQEVGHLRALKTTVGGIPRPLINLSAENFAKFFDEAFEETLVPPFDPYRDSISYMIGSYVVPYVGLIAYVGANPFLCGYKSKRLQSGLLGVEAGQDAVIRTYLYERGELILWPYNRTVKEFTVRISELRNRLGMCGVKDEGIVVPPQLGAENRTTSNILSADVNSLSYARTPMEVLRIMYDTADEHHPGGFFPRGANGRIARQYLRSP